MKNARKEFCEVVSEQSAQVKCAYVCYEKSYGQIIRPVLKVGYSAKDYENFLDSLDFDYDNGFGSQELFGIIWLEDNAWFSRDEYDGAEAWEYNVVPEIPAELDNINIVVE